MQIVGGYNMFSPLSQLKLVRHAPYTIYRYTEKHVYNLKKSLHQLSHYPQYRQVTAAPTHHPQSPLLLPFLQMMVHLVALKDRDDVNRMHLNSWPRIYHSWCSFARGSESAF